MRYGYNLSAITLNDFAGILKRSYLIPSMRMLREGLDENFGILEQHGIESMEALYLQMKTKKKAETLAEHTGMDMDYMIVLRRMVSSYIPKPRKLEEYPDIDSQLLEALLQVGIKHSIQLHEVLSSKTDEELETAFNINPVHAAVLRMLLDVGQLRYVSPLFATVLVRSGYDTIEKIANTEATALHQAIIKTNREQNIYKGNVGDSDAQFLVDDAKVFLGIL